MIWSKKMDIPEALTLQNVLEMEREWKLKVSYDLGCGLGKDTVSLLKKDWKVNAVDQRDDAREWFNENAKPYHKQLNFIQKSFTDIKWQPSELINATFSLPFCPRDKFASLWHDIRKSLITDGIFCGQLFGKNDEWKDNAELIFHSREEIKLLTQGFEIIQFIEIEKEAPSIESPTKHWHFFHLVLKKSGGL